MLYTVYCIVASFSNIDVKKMSSIRTQLKSFFYYKWAKQTKFLFAVIYGSPRRYSNSSFIIILGLTESFKTMNRPDRDAHWRHISRKISMIRTWNWYYKNLELISLTVLKLCDFRQRSHFFRKQFFSVFLFESLKRVHQFSDPTMFIFMMMVILKLMQIKYFNI